MVLGSWNPEFIFCPFRARIWPFQAPKTLRFKGKMANFEAKNAIKQGKNAKRTNGAHFMQPTPLNPTPATCHMRKQTLRCSFRKVAVQKLHCNIRFSAVRTSFLPEAALQQAKNCTATLKKLRRRKVALSCRFPADFKLPRLGSHV